MRVCEECKTIYHLSSNFCPNCGRKLSIPKKTDAFLKKFLEIDDKTLKRFKEIRKETIEQVERFNKKDKTIKALGVSGSARDRFDMANEDSNSEFLLLQALDELKSNNIETELLRLRKCDIKPCKACYSTTNTQCHFYCSCYPKGTNQADDMSNIIYDKVLESDIIIFATPVNNFKISSLMALFLDRCISLDGSLAPADRMATKDKELNIKHTKFVELTADPKIPGSGFLRRFIGKVAGIIVSGHEEGTAMVISSLFMTLNNFGMIFPPWSSMYAVSSIMNSTYKDKNIVNNSVYIEEAKQVARNTMLAVKLLRGFNNNDWENDFSSN